MGTRNKKNMTKNEDFTSFSLIKRYTKKKLSEQQVLIRHKRLLEWKKYNLKENVKKILTDTLFVTKNQLKQSIYYKKDKIIELKTTQWLQKQKDYLQKIITKVRYITRKYTSNFI